jgi:alginate O-acetyltransferase complex protein AlgI
MLIAMGLVGIWHGLTLNYLVWGLYHGALLSIESLMAHYGIRPLSGIPASTVAPVRIAFTFALVTFGWILFKYPLSDALIFLRRMVAW